MSITNWRDLFEEYRTGGLSDEERISFELALEKDGDLRSDYDLFLAYHEALEHERIRKKLSSIRKAPKNDKGKYFTGLTSFLLAFIVAGLCYFAYKVIMDRPATDSEVEESNNRQTLPTPAPADSVTLQNDQSNLSREDQEKKQTIVHPSRSNTQQPLASSTSKNLSEQLVDKYLEETTITKVLLRSNTQTDYSLADQVRNYLKARKYSATINLLKEKDDLEGIHPDDKLWFLSLAYLGDKNLIQAKSSLKEIATDGFNTHHKIASQLLAEIDILKQ